ncbi:MAG: hypothetical protein R3D34_15010 [Nitratireductor sp.]
MAGLTLSQSEVGAMNVHTEETCTNIKTIVDADNELAYKIFTIAYDVANGSSVKDLLYNCASSTRQILLRRFGRRHRQRNAGHRQRNLRSQDFAIGPAPGTAPALKGFTLVKNQSRLRQACTMANFGND